MPTGSHAIEIATVGDGFREPRADAVAVEEPLEIRITLDSADGRSTHSISITMRTPGHDAELAAGFLLSEGIIRRVGDIADVVAGGDADSDSSLDNVVTVELASGVSVDVDRLKRHFYTTSSCGVCGKASLDALRATGAGDLHANDASFPP